MVYGRRKESGPSFKTAAHLWGDRSHRHIPLTEKVVRCLSSQPNTPSNNTHHRTAVRVRLSPSENQQGVPWLWNHTLPPFNSSVVNQYIRHLHTRILFAYAHRSVDRQTIHATLSATCDFQDELLEQKTWAPRVVPCRVCRRSSQEHERRSSPAPFA